MDAPLGATRTVAEVNCRLCDFDVGAQRLSVPACPDVFVRPDTAPGFDAATIPVRSPSGAWPRGHRGDDDSAAPPHPITALARPALDQLSAVGAFVSFILTSRASSSSSTTTAAHPAPLAWHRTRPLLAAVDSADVVQIYDFSESVPYLSQSQSTPPGALAPVGALSHELQAGAHAGAAAWRPGAGLALAVGCARGVCLWQLSSPSPSAQGAFLTWLQSPGEAPVTALAWHPRGRLLAAASPARPGLFVWDVATGAVTTVRAGLETVTILSWSPCGAYVLAAGAGSGGFRLYETAGWRSAKWNVGGGDAGELVAAAWAPSGRTLLLAHRAQVSALHLTTDPPALTAQVLPVPLAGVDGANTISGMAWDPRGQRLAVALGGSGGGSAGASVALYDTRCDPILTARLIGKARIAPMRGVEGLGDADWEIVEAEEARSGVGGEAMAAGDGTKRPSLAFMPGFAQGAVLSVRQGDFVGTLPMYF